MTQFPQKIGLQKWADTPFVWQGAVALTSLPRLHSALDSQSQAQNDPTLDLQVSLTKEDGVLWLNFTVQGRLWLNCDRCLLPLSQDVSGDYRLAVIRSDNELAAIGEFDYIKLDELDGDKMLPIGELLQDELLLCLPLSATHDNCQMAIDTTVLDDELKDNPFAVLASLKSSS